MRKTIIAIISICVALTADANLFAEVIKVPEDFETVQAAIDDDGTEDGDTVLVAPGEYFENINFHRKNITLLGDQENPEEVIINANGEGRVVRIDMIENEAVLMGFTITGGYLIRGGGAGIFVMESSAIVRNCRIVENRTRTPGGNVWGRGAGIDCSSSELTVTDCVFLDNRSGRYGGAIQCLLESIVNIRNCVFSRNGGHEGAQIGCWESELNIEDCEFTDSRSGDEGSFIYGIFLRNSNVSIENINIHDDFHPIVTLDSDVTINGCSFDRNHATSEPACGGALWSMGESRVIVTRSVFTRNRAFDGGHAAYGSEESEVLLVNCTITQHEDGSGSLLDGVDVLNSIIWGNECDYYPNSNFTFCNVQDGADDEGNIDEDPLFVDPDEGDYHLTEDSPCIDASDPDSPLDPDSTRADMGAYYFHQRDIDVDPDSLEFLGVQTGIIDTLTVTIRNIGLMTLTIYSLSLDDEESPFEIISEIDTFSLEAESETTALITFASEEQAEYRTTLRITSDDPDEDTVLIPLIGTALGVAEEVGIPLSFAITGVYPNPFNSTTTITYGLDKSASTRLALYDLSGRMVRMLVDGKQNAGFYRTILSAENMPSGVYFCRLVSNGRERVVKMVLMR